VAGPDERQAGASRGGAPRTGPTRVAAHGVHEPEREGRQLAFAAVFEADFGLRTATAVLEGRLSEEAVNPRAAAHARRLVEAVGIHRPRIDERIEAAAPAYRVVQLARVDRALLRCAVGELLHCPTTPARVAISEWVELARTYSGEPARRLMNGALGSVAKDVTDAAAAGRDGPIRAPGRRRE
jgi:N utilization substance protein B